MPTYRNELTSFLFLTYHAGLSGIEIRTSGSPAQFLQEMIQKEPTVECHSIVDLGSVIHQLHNWKQLLPRVHPYYGNLLLLHFSAS